MPGFSGGISIGSKPFIRAESEMKFGPLVLTVVAINGVVEVDRYNGIVFLKILCEMAITVQDISSFGEEGF